MFDIVIIGAGTAGLSAAVYGVRAGKSVLVLESKVYGGQIINTPEIENYPGIKKTSGYEYATNLYEQAVELGAEIKYAKVNSIKEEGSIKLVETQEGDIPCRAVIIATGAKNRPLGLEKEEELVGSGISYCATCDGFFYKGKTVGVVGGGNTALEDATFLSEYCQRVYLIHRRDTFKGEQKLLEGLKDKTNVSFVTDTIVEGLHGERSLTGIRIKNLKSNEEKDIILEGLFIAIGQMPENEPFSPPVTLDKYGYIVAGEDCKTNIPGIFTAGDCRTKAIRQLTTAAADGTVAALAACEFVGNY